MNIDYRGILMEMNVVLILILIIQIINLVHSWWITKDIYVKKQISTITS